MMRTLSLLSIVPLTVAVLLLAASCSSGTTDTTATTIDEVATSTSSIATTTTTTSQPPETTTTAALLVTIMHVGDGVTEGDQNRSTYRCFLDTMLHDAGVAFDFVGSRQKPGYGFEYTCPTDFDQDHDAWNGAIAGGMETEKMTESVEALQPDVALIHLGGDDVWRQNDPVGAAERLKLFITGLQAVSPDTTLLVSSMIPCNTPLPWCTEGYPALNDLIASFGSLSTDESIVMFVDMTTGISVDLLRSNNLEFTDAGDEVMAGRWMAALEESRVISTGS